MTLSAPIKMLTITAGASAKASASLGLKTHHMVVTLNVDTYYASVDEASTPLSDAAAALLQSDDLPGFFASCGPYYVRAINRNAKFMAIFSYMSTESKADASFEAKMQAEIKGIELGAEFSSEFSSEASAKRLTIVMRGWGLGKNEDASLVATDLASFRDAVKDAFVSMQRSDTGRVVSIEVVPWVENTEFQRQFPLNAEEEVDGKKIKRYEMKDILSFNGEFIAEMNRAMRNRLQLYYKARVCQDHIIANYTSDGRKLMSEFANQKLVNHKTQETKLSVAQLYKKLPGLTDRLYEDYIDFAYNGKVSVQSCQRVLFDPPEDAKAQAKKQKEQADDEDAEGPIRANRGEGAGVYRRRYNEHKECLNLEKKFSAVLSSEIDDYCMPDLAR